MQKTMFSILYTKFLENLDRSTLEDILLTTAKLFCWIIISISLINIPEASEKLAMVVKGYDFASIKILTSFILVFHSKKIVKMGKSIVTWIEDEFFGNTEEVKMYQNIPLIELVDYIFSATSYSRNEFCEQFSVSRKVFDDLASGLDKIGVFVRGANNSRILSEEFSRTDISSILSRASESGEIRPLIRETKSGYTHSPSMPEIQSRFKTMTLAEYAS